MYQENIIGCLGSRAILFVDAKNNGFWPVPLGTVFQKQVLVRPYIHITTQQGGVEKMYLIGPNWRRGNPVPRKVCQAYLEKTMNGITIQSEFFKHGLLCKLKIWHGFYPGDIDAATLPAFYCDVELTKKTNSNWVKPEPAQVEYGFELHCDHADELRTQNHSVNLSLSTRVDRDHYILSGWNHRARNLEDRDYKNELILSAQTPFSATEENTFATSQKCTLQEKETKTFSCTVAMYSLQKIMKYNGQFLPFRYQQKYSSANQVLNEALQRKDQLREKADFLESCFENASLSKDALELIALSWHSYLMNTWWLIEDSQDRYFVWEGCCAFLSTVDVEYNITPLYLQFWPELLRMQLIQWLDFVQDDILAHDVGMMLTGGKMEYPHPMPVEENANFLLMLLAYWKYTGDDQTLRQCFDAASRLSAYITNADTDNDGFVEKGTANTIDDADVSVQYAPKQVYLGVKAACAQLAFSQIAEYLHAIQGISESQKQILAGAKKFHQTATAAVTKTFNGTHFPVCAPNASDVKFKKLQNFETSEEDHDQELPGLEGCSIYVANGTVLPGLCGIDTGLDPNLLKQDLLHARRQTKTRYGHTHSSYDNNRIWISQNMWSDIFSAYIGLDPRENFSRYALMQEDINSLENFGGQFTDTWSFAELNYYPRGITSIGVFLAIAGVAVDRTKNEVKFTPPAVPVNVPLFFLTDWQNRKCPWLSATLKNGKCKLTLRGPVPQNIKFTTDPSVALEIIT